MITCAFVYACLSVHVCFCTDAKDEGGEEKFYKRWEVKI